MSEEKSDFLRNLFFYIVSFIGLMIFIFSIVSVISSFFSVGYPKVPAPEMGSMPAYRQVDVRSLINSGTGAVVGFFVWFFSWRSIQKEYNVDDK